MTSASLDLIVDAILVVAGVLSVVSDLRARRIYNWITYPTFLLGLALALAGGGLGEGWTSPGLRGALVGAIAASLMFVVSYALNWGGLGDAKLMAGYGALLGFPASLGAVLAVSCAMLVTGVLAALARTRPGRSLLARAGVEGTANPEFAKWLPLGPAIVVGTLLFRLWQRLPVEPLE